MKGQKSIYLITSCKGGVGKSTVAVNLAFAMALCGQSVILADCDTKNRTADLMLGYDGVGMFDLSDVSCGRAKPTEATLRDPRCERLYYCTVPPTGAEMSPLEAARSAVSCADAVGAEVIIFDTSGGIEFPLAIYPDIVYDAIIVTTESSPALRAAERTGGELFRHGVKNLRLVINSFSGKGACITDIIDEARVSLLGIVPFDRIMRAGQEAGMPASAVEGAQSQRAFYNIAMRLRGADIPLFSGLRVRGRRKLISSNLCLSERRSDHDVSDI